MLSNAAKIPHAIDVEVGSRIRMQRKVKGISQQALAAVLGITFQNRQLGGILSASRPSVVRGIIHVRRVPLHGICRCRSR
jgi:hypothetical protein